MTYERFFSHAAEQMRESAIRKMGTLGTRIPDLISFAPGYPDPATFPWERFRAIAASLLSGADGSTLQYGPTRGFRPLVEALETILAPRGIASAFEQRVITSGSQQGLDLVAKVLIDPGDAVIVELPTYTGAISAFRNALADLVGVPQEDDGIDLTALDHTVRRLRGEGRRVRLLYLVPNFQNPTGLLIGLDKRRALLEWAERADILIIEDDPYGDLYFPDSATAEETRPIKADDRAGRVDLSVEFFQDAGARIPDGLDRRPGSHRHQVRHRQAGGRPVHRRPRSARGASGDRARGARRAGAAPARALPGQAHRDATGDRARAGRDRDLRTAREADSFSGRRCRRRSTPTRCCHARWPPRSPTSPAARSSWTAAAATRCGCRSLSRRTSGFGKGSRAWPARFVPSVTLSRRRAATTGSRCPGDRATRWPPARRGASTS